MRKLLMIASLVLLMGSAEPSERSHESRKPRSTIRQRSILYEPYIQRAAARYGVDPRVLWTIAYLESRFNPRAVSPKGARGLMQFMPGTARRYGLINPHDPITSIDAAARYVRDLCKRFGGRIDLVLAAYNAGEYAVTSAGFRVPHYRETRAYVAQGKVVLGRDQVHAVTAISMSPEQSRTSPTRSIYFTQ